MKWVLRIFGLVVVMVAIVIAGVLMLPSDRIAQVAVDQIRAQTGRDVTLRGETRVSYYPVLGVSTGALEIANADWSDAGPLMVADSLKVGVDLMSLIGGEVKITGLEAVNPDVLLEKAADGRGNWQLGVAGVAPSGQASGFSSALALSLDRALISGGRMRYVDHGTGAEYRLDDLSVDLQWPQYRGSATFEVSGLPQGRDRLNVSGEFADLAALIERETTQIAIAAETAGGSLTYEGDVNASGYLDGALTADLPDSAAFLAALGIAGVELPPGLGRKAAATARLTLTDRTDLALRGLQVTLDQNRLEGDVAIDLAGPMPEVTAELAAGTLDLSGATVGGAGGPDGGGWSTSPIDASALGLFNGQITLVAQGLKASGLTFGPASLTATLDRSRAVLDLAHLAGYSGALNGQVVVNNRQGLSLGGSVAATGVEVQSLLTDLAGISRFTGQAEARVKFLGAGNSVHAIMNSLSGDGSVSMGRGTIRGIDLDSLIRSGLPTGGTTVFDSLSATFTMDQGNLYNDDLLLQLPVVSATGAGRVGLGARDIDYLFTPRTGSADVPGGIAIPVRIRGPWSNPAILPDMEKAIDLNLKKEKEAAKAKVEEKVKQKLGIEAEEGQSLEDAAKEKLEQELFKGLGKLLK